MFLFVCCFRLFAVFVCSIFVSFVLFSFVCSIFVCLCYFYLFVLFSFCLFYFRLFVLFSFVCSSLFFCSDFL